MAGPFRVADYEHFVQLETAFNTSPGALAGTDAFRCQTEFPFKRDIARYDRTKDKDASASAVSTQKGREKSSWQIQGDAIPAGNAATPTDPDMDPFFEAHFGQKHKATAHTTTAAGSTGTTLNLTGGGGAASGIAIGDIIVVDVDATNGLEARQVTNIVTDVVTVDRAFTANPGTGRNVYVGTTYRFSVAQLKTLHLWEYLSGNNFRQKAGGCIARNLTVESDWNGETPVTNVTLGGDGAQLAPHSTSKPTPTLVGEPHAPAQMKVWFGANQHCAVKASVKSDNSIELRTTDSCSLFPTGVKRTANDGKYVVEMAIELLLTTGTIEGYHDVADDLTAYDVICQLGVSPGKMVVWRARKFVPDAMPGNAANEVSLQLNGRCYASATTDDELALAFL